MKILYWIPTILFYFTFGAVLGLFHIAQVIALRIGYQAHKSVVDAMVVCLNASLLVVGARRKVVNQAGNLSRAHPVIIVSNHQSMFDVPALGNIFRKNHPKYIAKDSLAKGVPSISINIRKGGSIAINRKDKESASKAILAFTDYLNQNNFSGSIFPEGTRSKDGSVAMFRRGGLKVMIEAMPDATIVPVALQNFWKIGRYRMKPIPFGIALRCTVLPPIDRAGKTPEEIIELLESQIRATAESTRT
ncbi:MAG: lysophospholipid acyltransferase family protein [Bacteroidota bacterium]